MILEYEEICMFLLNIEVFNMMTPDLPYTSENKTKYTILYIEIENFNDRIIYTFHIQCIIKVEDLNALYLEN